MPRRVQRGDEHVGHGVAGRGRPGAKHLRHHAGREHLGRGRGADQRFNLLAGLGDPGAQKQVLRLPHHRPFAAQQDVDPGRKARRHAEFGVGAVLAAAKGDAVVDDGDLAVVAQVEPADGQVAQAWNVVQRGQHAHAGVLQLPPARRADEGARAERIDHHAAGHAAPGGGADGVGHLAAVVVVQPDVEADVHVFARGGDVDHQGVDGGVGVAHGLIGRGVRVTQRRDAVAGDGRQAVDRAAEVEQRAGLAAGWMRGGRRGRRQAFQGLAQPLRAAASDAGFAEQKVRHHADQRQQHDDRDPGGARGRRAVGPRERAGRHAQMHRKQQQRGQLAERRVRKTGVEGHAGAMER